MAGDVAHEASGQVGSEAMPTSADTKEMSVIGADIVVTGNIEASVGLFIGGKVVGDVRCDTLILGKGSLVKGRVYAARVKVSGRIDGAVETADLAIDSTACVKGKITYDRISIANGGVLEGRMTRKVR